MMTWCFAMMMPLLGHHHGKMDKVELTIVIVTHNMQQAARISDYTAFFTTDESRIGQMVEFSSTKQIL